jgi:hypothetical protein
MKHLTYLLFLLMSFSLFAQEGTTLEEYRYLSKGYLYQKELGLDIYKSGYKVQTLFTTSKDAQLIGLYEDGRNEIKALLVVIEEPGQTPIYICIPRGNSDERVLSLYNLDVQRLINVESRKMYDNAMQEFLYSSLNNSMGTEQPTTLTPESYEMMSKSNSQAFNDASEDILVSKGGTESVVMTESDKVTEQPVKEPAKPIMTQATATISGDVLSREIIVAPNVQTESDKKGSVAVKVCVDMDGFVLSAKYTQRGSTTLDKDLKKVAVDAASKYRFDKSERKEECGIITFQF